MLTAHPTDGSCYPGSALSRQAASSLHGGHPTPPCIGSFQRWTLRFLGDLFQNGLNISTPFLKTPGVSVQTLGVAERKALQCLLVGEEQFPSNFMGPVSTVVCVLCELLSGFRTVASG